MVIHFDAGTAGSFRTPHADGAIVAARNEHTGIGRIPTDSVDDAGMTAQHGHWFFAFAMPHVHVAI